MLSSPCPVRDAYQALLHDDEIPQCQSGFLTSKSRFPVLRTQGVIGAGIFTKPYLAGQSEDDKNTWKDEKTTISNRELKGLLTLTNMAFLSKL